MSKKKLVNWTQTNHKQTDITELVDNCSLSLRKLSTKCGLHYTYLSKAINGKVEMSENAFANFVCALEDYQK